MKPHKLTWHIHDIEYSPSGDVIMMYILIDQWSLDAEHIYSRSDESIISANIQPFKAGQFMLLSTYIKILEPKILEKQNLNANFSDPDKTRKISIDDKQVKRSYSIATTPSYYLATGLIWFSIKRVEWWIFSTRATQIAKKWDQLHLTGPLGHMVDTGVNKNYLFICAGSWLSPIYALYNDLITEKKLHMKAAFLYGERHISHILPSVEAQLHQNTDPHVHIQKFLSQDTHEWYQQGRLQIWLDTALTHIWTKDMSCFICGKPEMVSDVVEILLAKGIEKENIKFEKY